jgi:LmbE family N-acetylglucosaminyl deacetylase
MRILGLRDGFLPTHWGAVKEALEQVSRSMTADVVFAPRPDDAHQDHRLIAELAPTVWRDALMLHYEIPKWDGDLGRVSHYVALEPEIARRKVELLHECFPSQAGRDWWDDETFLSLMRIRGVECRRRYAEGFTVTKALLSLRGGERDG